MIALYNIVHSCHVLEASVVKTFENEILLLCLVKMVSCTTVDNSFIIGTTAKVDVIIEIDVADL